MGDSLRHAMCESRCVQYSYNNDINKMFKFVGTESLLSWRDQSRYVFSLTNSPFEMGQGCGQLRSVKRAQQVNSFFHSVYKIVHIYVSP